MDAGGRADIDHIVGGADRILVVLAFGRCRLITSWKISTGGLKEMS